MSGNFSVFLMIFKICQNTRHYAKSMISSNAHACPRFTLTSSVLSKKVKNARCNLTENCTYFRFRSQDLPKLFPAHFLFSSNLSEINDFIKRAHMSKIRAYIIRTLKEGSYIRSVAGRAVGLNSKKPPKYRFQKLVKSYL